MKRLPHASPRQPPLLQGIRVMNIAAGGWGRHAAGWEGLYVGGCGLEPALALATHV